MWSLRAVFVFLLVFKVCIQLNLLVLKIHDISYIFITPLFFLKRDKRFVLHTTPNLPALNMH